MACVLMTVQEWLDPFPLVESFVLLHVCVGGDRVSDKSGSSPLVEEDCGLPVNGCLCRAA